MKQIIALGDGGFSDEPKDRLLNQYIREQAGSERPKILYLPQAGGESPEYILSFYEAFLKLGARPSWFSLFGTVVDGWEDNLLAQDIIYVGGGNTKSLLGLWRTWGVDQVLRQAWEQGVILAGVSAGAICWFEQGHTDSMSPSVPLDCLGFLSGSCCPHYDGEPHRRPDYLGKVGRGEILPGIALCDNAAAHFIDGRLSSVVTGRPEAKAYHVTRDGDEAIEDEIATLYIGRG